MYVPSDAIGSSNVPVIFPPGAMSNAAPCVVRVSIFVPFLKMSHWISRSGKWNVFVVLFSTVTTQCAIVPLTLDCIVIVAESGYDFGGLFWGDVVAVLFFMTAPSTFEQYFWSDVLLQFTLDTARTACGVGVGAWEAVGAADVAAGDPVALAVGDGDGEGEPLGDGVGIGDALAVGDEIVSSVVGLCR